jgi:uncharacterized Zn finger protein
MTSKPSYGGMSRRSSASAPLRPRRVRSGVRLARKSGPPAVTWAGEAWMHLFEHGAAPEQYDEGLAYGRSGQTTRMTISPGGVQAVVVGRSPKPYEVSINVAAFDADTWDRVIQTMSDQAIYAAKLLAGQLPANIEELFRPLGRTLAPSIDEIDMSCTCDVGQPPCKHQVCLASLLAERLDTDPFLLFTLRGMDGDAFLERLRQRRALDTVPGEPAAAYTPSPPAGASITPPALEHCLEEFWSTGDELAEMDAEPGPPEVEHALLRRLGSAPFENARFPLVGLLATCYDTISAYGLRRFNGDEAGDAAPDQHDAAEDDDGDRSPDVE